MCSSDLKAEYTLTATVGGDVPGPGGKPSDKYDLSDVYSGHLEDVKKAIDMGLMSGTGAAGKFNPKGKIAREPDSQHDNCNRILGTYPVEAVPQVDFLCALERRPVPAALPIHIGIQNQPGSKPEACFL